METIGMILFTVFGFIALFFAFCALPVTLLITIPAAISYFGRRLSRL